VLDKIKDSLQQDHAAMAGRPQERNTPVPILIERCRALSKAVKAATGGPATGAIAFRAECGPAVFADPVAQEEVRETLCCGARLGRRAV